MSPARHEIGVSSGPEALETLTRFCREKLEEPEDPEISLCVQLVLEELVTNVLRHGYRGKEGPIHLTVEQDEGGIALTLRDRAPAFNPLAWRGRIDRKGEGKRGLPLVRRLSDRLEYERTEAGENILRCTFHARKAPEGQQGAGRDLRAAVDETAEIESELGLLFHLTPVNRTALLAAMEELAANREVASADLGAEYPPMQFDPAQVERRLEALESGPASRLGPLWSLRIGQLRDTVALLRRRGTGAFAPLAEAMYGRPDQQLLDWAGAILEDPGTERARLLQEAARLDDGSWPPAPPEPDLEAAPADANRAAAYLGEVIRFYELNGVDVRVTDRLTAHAMVEGGRLWLRRDATFDPRQMARLAVHEVGVHLRRRAERPDTVHPLLEMESPHGPGTEEGMTVLAEALAGSLEPEVLKMYAGRVVAIHAARSAGAPAVLRTLAEHGFEPREAATLLLRAKRGTADFAEPGAFPKDLCYLGGARSVMAFLRGGGSIAPLFDCLLSIEDLPLLPEGILPAARCCGEARR